MKDNQQTDRFQRVVKAASIHYDMEIGKTMAAITDDFPDNPAAMKYFYEKHRNLIRNDSNGKLPSKKTIATLCIHVPVELILAVGAIPVRSCAGAFTTEQLGAEFLPAKSCPMVKSTLGAISYNLLHGKVQPDLIINPATCDQKKKLGEINEEISEKFYLLEMPSTKDSEESREYWLQTVFKLIRKLESVTGNKLTAKSLKRAIQEVAHAQRLYRKFNHIRTSAPVILGKDALLVTNAFFFDDLESWSFHLNLLNEELENRMKTGFRVVNERAPRILLTGSPSVFPNMKMPLLVEELGGFIVSEEFCSSSRMLWDTVAVDEWHLYDMIPALADRYLKPSTCPNFSPNTDRIRKLLSAIEEYKIDGVVCQTFTGCQLYDMETRIIAKAMEQAGIQTLFVETDYSPEDIGQLTTRVEAFLHSLKHNRKKQLI
ncbi:MAG: 2-hydroxyacyl-CoA dehydratase family protein [Bacteroidetes bacterium]|nr:2-hydroxyacyl-CoA dehydratase family protein [Bacteroidota bacterium]MBU1580149.1 2-hydroxyacyl-CoA dehydratase family protein [Bacteroidota bacterium]MBU2558874.1 2-hydroxyacyl-CoA dehydratase family protein [Bacteroidota bacterium]